jgi:enoyl-CoA hydratase
VANEAHADEPHLKMERDGDVVILTMNNPRRKNALTPAMITLMARAWEEIDADDAIRVAILTGAGSSYCVGGDLADGWMVKGAKESHGSAVVPEGKSVGSVISEGLLLSRYLAKPLIAAVNGPCLGGGCEMLQQTDIRVAEEHAVFGLPEAQLGLIAGAGSTVRLKRQIPYTKAMEMILTGEPLTAAEAYHFGLVGHVVPTGQSLTKARELAARVASNGPLAIRNAKASVINSGWIDEEDARRIERRLVVEVMRSEDAKEGLAAFAAKRPPRFTSRWVPGPASEPWPGIVAVPVLHHDDVLAVSVQDRAKLAAAHQRPAGYPLERPGGPVRRDRVCGRQSEYRERAARFGDVEMIVEETQFGN